MNYTYTPSIGVVKLDVKDGKCYYGKKLITDNIFDTEHEAHIENYKSKALTIANKISDYKENIKKLENNLLKLKTSMNIESYMKENPEYFLD